MMTTSPRALLLGLAFAAMGTAHAADKASGKVTVAGKPFTVTQGVAVKDGDDVRVILCDGPAPFGDVRADFARRDLAEKGTLHCVENRITADARIVSTTVLHNAFKMFPSAVSSWMAFEPGAKTPGRIRGRIRTTQEELSFDKIPYTWDVTFDLAVAPGKP